MCLNQVKAIWISRALWVTIRTMACGQMESPQSLRRMARLDLHFKRILLARLLRLDLGGEWGRKYIKQGKYILIIYYIIIKFSYYKFISLIYEIIIDLYYCKLLHCYYFYKILRFYIILSFSV